MTSVCHIAHHLDMIGVTEVDLHTLLVVHAVNAMADCGCASVRAVEDLQRICRPWEQTSLDVSKDGLVSLASDWSPRAPWIFAFSPLSKLARNVHAWTLSPRSSM